MPFFGYRWQGLLNRHGNFRDDRLEVERAPACAEKQNAPALYRRGRAGRDFFDFFVLEEDSFPFAGGSD